MNDFAAPWPVLVKRIRFLSSLKQADLAETLNVDQTSVSRWERGHTIPDFSVQKRLRDMLRNLEPVIDRRFIESAPGFMSVSRMDAVGFLNATSEASAGQFQHTPSEMRDRWFYDLAPEHERACMETIDATKGWREGEVVYLTARLCILGLWVEYKVAPIGQTDLCLCIGAALPPQEDLSEDEFQLTFKSYDELCE